MKTQARASPRPTAPCWRCQPRCRRPDWPFPVVMRARGALMAVQPRFSCLPGRGKSVAHPAGVIAVEDVLQQPAFEVGGAEEPVRHRIGQVEVALHHDRRIVMGDVVAADGIHQRDAPYQGVILHMAAIVKQLIVQIKRGIGDQQQPARIGPVPAGSGWKAGTSESVMNATSA